MVVEEAFRGGSPFVYCPNERAFAVCSSSCLFRKTRAQSQSKAREDGFILKIRILMWHVRR